VADIHQLLGEGAARGVGKPETFDFLGFTYDCGKTNSGHFWLTRQTISKRMRAKLAEVEHHYLRRRHQPIPEQGRWLASVGEGTSRTTPCPATATPSGPSATR
jgi:hypothetical protein